MEPNLKSAAKIFSTVARIIVNIYCCKCIQYCGQDADYTIIPIMLHHRVQSLYFKQSTLTISGNFLTKVILNCFQIFLLCENHWCIFGGNNIVYPFKEPHVLFMLFLF